MDIKPQNVLVRRANADEYRAYLADFGLSRSFVPSEHSQTDGPTSLTPRYCAPEVFQYKLRGRSADVFSLGCVFAEMFTVPGMKHPHDFADYRKGRSEDESFHANLGRVDIWLYDLNISYPPYESMARLSLIFRRMKKMLEKMLSCEPESRPTVSDILTQLPSMSKKGVLCSHQCCDMPPEQYVAYEITPSS
jgi:serine/threonine protein kinase